MGISSALAVSRMSRVDRVKDPCLFQGEKESIMIWREEAAYISSTPCQEDADLNPGVHNWHKDSWRWPQHRNPSKRNTLERDGRKSWTLESAVWLWGRNLYRYHDTERESSATLPTA